MIDDHQVKQFVRRPVVRNWLEVLAAFALMRMFVRFGGLLFLPLSHWINGRPASLWVLTAIFVVPAILFFISVASGWFGLGITYSTKRPRPNNLRTGSASFRFVFGYNNVLRMGSDREGLYLTSWVRLFHPPLFIPWSDVEVGHKKKMLFQSYRSLKLGLANKVPFSIDGKTADRLLLDRDGGTESAGAKAPNFQRT